MLLPPPKSERHIEDVRYTRIAIVSRVDRYLMDLRSYVSLASDSYETARVTAKRYSFSMPG